MHQPDFRDAATGRFRLPWVYLHAAKDYVDMAAHLERHPAVRAVVNFVPILLDQLEDYADQFRTGTLRDPLLAAFSAHKSGHELNNQLAILMGGRVAEEIIFGREYVTTGASNDTECNVCPSGNEQMTVPLATPGSTAS